jgi:hypothetical protein
MPRSPSQPTVSVEAFLAQYPREIQALAEQMRDLIRAAAPGAVEAARQGWGAITYKDRHVGYFCGLFPTFERLQVVFEFGILLPDPLGLLTGSGSQTRTVELYPGEEFPAVPLRELIEAALSLPASRQARLDLIRRSAKPAGI